MTASEVYLACDVGHVRVKLGFGDTLSPLEETALRVIAAMEGQDDAGLAGQRTDIRELAKLLGLGYRVVLDLVHDLWRAGYLVVDFSSNAIGLSPDVRALLASDRLAELAGVETEDRAVELMVERLTGYVMPSHGPRAPGDSRLAVRFVSADLGLGLAEAGQVEINQAIRSWLRRQESHHGDGAAPEAAAARGRERRILSVRPAAPDRNVTPGRRWYRLDVQAEINEASGRLIVTVVDRRFPADRRELASDRLTRLAEEFPTEPFVARLRASAESRLVDPPSLEELIERLTMRVANGDAVAAGKRRFEHEEWAEESRRIDAMIDSRIAHEVEAEVVLGSDQHLAALAQLIDEAQKQIVVVCPWITDHALERVVPHLRAAIDRGVQIVIVWGIGYQATLPENVRNALDSLARQSRTAPMLRPQVSANTHAKLVVCDDRTALVTSRNVLSATRPRPEIGLLLRVPEGRDSAAICDLLAWARINVPGSISRSVLWQADRFGTVPSWGGGDLAAPTLRLEDFPEEPPEDLEQTGAVQAWSLAWTAHTARLRDRLAGRRLPATRLVEDGAHRELLWLALTTAERRVVIASGQLSDEVVNGRMVDAIGALLTRGVAVTLGYDEHGGADRGQAALSALADLAAIYPELLTIHAGTGHAKVLVHDDDVVVGSYNYLSYSGHGAAGGRHMLRSELGVRLTSATIADSLAAACGEPSAVTTRVSGTAHAPAVSRPVPDLSALAAAQRILNRITGQRPGAVVRAELDRAADPWAVLEPLDRLGDGSAREPVAAYCLAYRATDVPADTAIRWRRRLVGDLISRGAFTEAWILRGADPDREASPRPAIIRTLAARGLPDNADALFQAVMCDDLTGDEQEALLRVATGESLASDDPAARDVVIDLASRAGGPWAELARLALKYADKATGASIAELMRGMAGQRRLEVRLGKAWDRLELALLDADAVPKELDGAKKTHAALFKDTGVFGRLRSMAARRDLPSLRAMVAAELPTRTRPDDLVGSIINATWAEVAPRNDLLEGRPRAKYVKRLAEVIAAARDLIALTEPADDGTGVGATPGQHPNLLAAAAELADGYQRLRPRLLEDSGPLAAAAANAVVADLDELIGGTAADQGSHRGQPGGEDLLLSWPGRWHYPELAAALQRGQANGRLPELLLAGLVDPMPPEETARQLIQTGEFAAAEALREQASLSPENAAAVVRELQLARVATRARLRYEADTWSRRGRRAAAAALPFDVGALEEQAEQRRADAEETLLKFAKRIKSAEEDLAKELEAAAADRLAASPVDEEAASAWLRSIMACLEAREFAAARSLLDQDPGVASVEDPRAVPPLAATWPFAEASAQAAMSWYFGEALECPPGFDRWRPPTSDVPAWDVLEALRAQLGEPCARHASALCGALQRLVGVQHPAAAAVQEGAGCLGRVYLPDNLRLPQNSVLGRGGVPVWIAGPADPPPEHPEGLLLWLVTGAARAVEAPPATMIVDLAFLFRIVAPVRGDTGSPETRLVNLVRRLGGQLSAGSFLGQPGRPFSEPHVTWLLDLLGATEDGVVAEAIHYDTGGRGEALIPLLDALLTAPVPGRRRHQRLDVAALNAVRADGTWQAEALRRLLAPLENDLAALLLLRVAAAFDDDVFTLEDLREGIKVAASAGHAETVLGYTNLPDAARRLHQAAIFEQAAGDLWRLPRNGVRDLLAGDWPGHAPLTEARRAIEAEYQHHQEAAARTRAELSDGVIRVIGHLVANRQAAARSARDRSDTERSWSIFDQLGPIYEMYLEAVGPVIPLSLNEVLTDHLNQTEFLNPAVRPMIGEDAGLRVMANRWLLGQAFQNLFDNARQAIEDTGREFGTLRVTVIPDAPGSAEERRCRIAIEDSGIGMLDRARNRFADGQPFSGRGGRGTGLLTARIWIRRYRGTLEVPEGGSDLGGARVLVSLPLLADDGSG